LLSPHIRDYMPLQENRLERDRATDDPGETREVALFNDDYRFLKQRVAQSTPGWPGTRSRLPRRLLTNVRVTVRIEAQEFLVNSDFLIKLNRLQDYEDQFAGGRRDVPVRGADASLKLTDRRIELDQNVISTKSFSLLF
jgi:3-phenylpropionate/cinnamic acid dioxygenase small subunit